MCIRDSYNIILSDTIYTDLSKLLKIKSVMNVQTTITSQDFHVNFINILYIGNEGCMFPSYLMIKDKTNQRYKRSTQTDGTQNLRQKRQTRHEPTIFETGLPVLTKDEIQQDINENIKSRNEGNGDLTKSGRTPRRRHQHKHKQFKRSSTPLNFGQLTESNDDKDYYNYKKRASPINLAEKSDNCDDDPSEKSSSFTDPCDCLLYTSRCV